VNVYRYLLFVSIAIILAACATKQPILPTPSTSASIPQATIQTIDITPPDNAAGQYVVLLHGQLAESCLTAEIPSVVRQGNYFVVFVDTQRDGSKSCSAGSFPFEHSIILDVSGLPDGEYDVMAGGVKASFALASAPANSATTALIPVTAPSSTPTVPAPVEEKATPAQINPTPTSQATTQTQTATEQASQIAPQSGCIDKASFDSDVTVPDNTSFRQDTAFTKTWRIRNEGTCAWGPSYALVFAGGDILNGPPSSPLPAVQPGDFVNISVNLTAPHNGGTYTSYWEFQNPQGQRFGVNSQGQDLIWVKIAVSYIVVDASGVAVGTPTPQSPSTCAIQRDAAYETQLLQLINEARSQQGRKPLTLNAKLSAAALAHSTDMACNNFVDHTGSDGSNWVTRIKAQGYKAASASENIYVGDPQFGGDAAGAFDWWMHSQIHRDNILSPKVTEIGIAYVYYPNSTYKGYYTLDFARP
jgi:uncharacterized protein YkwD